MFSKTRKTIYRGQKGPEDKKSLGRAQNWLDNMLALGTSYRNAQYLFMEPERHNKENIGSCLSVTQGIYLELRLSIKEEELNYTIYSTEAELGKQQDKKMIDDYWSR